jgi:hypothetical protein
MGKGTTALKKINARTKKLKKLHPGKKYATLRKQAANEYNAGTLPKARRKPAARKRRAKVAGKRKYKVTHKVRKVGAVRRKRLSPAVPKKKRVYRARKVAVRSYRAARYKRVGATGKSMVPMLVGVAAVGVLAYMLLKPKATLPVPLAPTNNPARAAAADNLVSWATAAGATATALTALINAINNMSDNEVTTAVAKVQTGTPINVAVPGAGPSIGADNLYYGANIDYTQI